MIELPPDRCRPLPEEEAPEWLVTDGRGGYACGTVSGVLDRSYHGLLIAALDPPLGRTLLVSKLNERLVSGEGSIPLGADRREGGRVDPDGYRRIESFRLEGTVPTWTYRAGARRLERRVFMEPGAPTTYVTYRLLSGAPVTLEADVLVNERLHHSPTPGRPLIELRRVPGGLMAGRAVVLCTQGEFLTRGRWREGFWLATDHARGYGALDRNLHAATLRVALEPGRTVSVVCSATPDPDPDGEEALGRLRRREAALVEAGPAGPPWVRQLVLAADQFLVRRGEGWTVIAGYPWFEDWGRDAMIALPGLALHTGRSELAGPILRTYAHHLRNGLIPNNFHENAPVYNTADASLWFFEALRLTWRATGDRDLLTDLYPALEEIVHRHLAGTDFGIGVDPADGLLRAGEEGSQVTWMDAKVEDWVVTPRHGKPVEINALWHQALVDMAEFAAEVGADADPYREAGGRVAAGFDRFWNPETGCLYDVLDGPEGHDPAVRPNQLLAVSMPAALLSRRRRWAVLESCRRRLLTPFGLRSLHPGHPEYRPRYRGDLRSRDAAYHQGTVWGWLLGPFALAHHRLHGEPGAALAFLEPMAQHLGEHGLGSIAEVFDGDPPHTPGGCPWQAWSVAETLWAWSELGSPTEGSVSR